MRWPWLGLYAGFPGRWGHVDRWLDEDARALLSPLQRRAVEGHLARCSRCQALARAEEQARAALAVLEPEEPPPGLFEAILARAGVTVPAGAESAVRAGTGSTGEGTVLAGGRTAAGTTPAAREAQRRDGGSDPVMGRETARGRGRESDGAVVRLPPWRRPVPAALAAVAVVGLILLAGRLYGPGGPAGSVEGPQGYEVAGAPASGSEAGRPGAGALAMGGAGVPGAADARGTPEVAGAQGAPGTTGAHGAPAGAEPSGTTSVDENGGSVAGAPGEPASLPGGPGTAPDLARPDGSPGPGTTGSLPQADPVVGGDADAAIRAAGADTEGRGPWLIRSGRLALAVPAVEPVFREAQAAARRLGGFTEQAQLEGVGPARSAYLVLRVPDDRLEDAMDRLAALAGGGRVDLRAMTAEDISRQWVDTQARLENLRAQEGRLRELAGRSGDVDELLRVEQELWRVRGEIEQLEGQVRYWQQAMRLARIELSLEALAPQPAPPAGDLGTRVRLALEASLRSLASLASLVVVAGAAALPYGALLGAGYLAWRGWRRRRGT